ncbi:MAG: hypothetical protein FIA97_08695 [Methylococcaceae bacterium]|nr:hypothetical protein [Methylococcaceae bacterium]
MMIEPVAPADMAASFAAAALVVLFGAGYAAVYAWARLSGRKNLLWWAYGCYGLLTLAVAQLAQLNHLDDTWQFLVLMMLIGYLLAPRAIWRLCAGTHDESDPGQ